MLEMDATKTSMATTTMKLNPMEVYHQLMRDILEKGERKSDRTGTGTYSLFGYQMRFDLNQGFPLVTTKKLHLRSIIHELLWFLKGDTNTQYLKDNNVSIWDEWADAEGNLGPVYGQQWRSWRSSDGRVIDQISQVIEGIKKIRILEDIWFWLSIREISTKWLCLLAMLSSNFMWRTESYLVSFIKEAPMFF